MRPSRCMHRLAGIDAVVIRRAREGYVAQCLMCGEVGAVRSNSQTAREALLDQQGARRERDEG